MGAGTDHLLTVGQARKLLTQLEQSTPREACWSCECLQGFLTQLEPDATEGARLLLGDYKVRPERLHGYLGCEPCPPAEVFANHLRAQ